VEEGIILLEEINGTWDGGGRWTDPQP
jgi:hypothetical protein